MVDKIITISLRKYLIKLHRTKRVGKAAKYIKQRVAHYMKVPIENILISTSLNNSLHKGYAKAMKRIRLNVHIEGNKATVSEFSLPNTTKSEATISKEANKNETKKEIEIDNSKNTANKKQQIKKEGKE
ncbi:MAG: hypothetical protein QXD11_02330 [Candidatus Micrarchaeaceae archaeon]